MKNDCQHYETLIADKLFGDLGPEDQQRLEAHLGACPACRVLVREMEATLQVTAARMRPALSPAYWEGYAERLEDRMRREERRPNKAGRLAEWLRAPGRLNVSFLMPAPRWAYQLSGAVALLAVGVLIGWLLFGGRAADAPRLAEGPPVDEMPVQPVSLEQRTDRYLERSKVLLLGLVNLDPDEQTSASLNLVHQQRVARELIDESNDLKTTLRGVDERLMRALIEDLEVILLQIANLEAGYDLPAIEMVQRGVDRRAIMLKINLTEMRRSDAALQPAVAPVIRSDSSTF